jgi:hypothetical protein
MIAIEKADLVDIEGEGLEAKCHCKICQKEMIEKIFNWYMEADRYLRRYSVKQREEASVSEDENEFSPETEIQEKPQVQKVRRPSILLKALRKSLQKRQENEGSEKYGSDGKRVQCRGPT